MNLLIKNIAIITALCFCLPATAQEHHDHGNHAEKTCRIGTREEKL
jgi:hypothetical protein